MSAAVTATAVAAVLFFDVALVKVRTEMAEQAETIFALSSGQDRAGVAVIRVSGPEAEHVLAALARVVATPRRAVRVKLRDPADGGALDDALALWFSAPKSFTGENVLELHVHGGRAVVSGVLSALGRLAGCRLAEPGEFTRRAFENGKIDLTEAEGLADLIAAETEAQRRLALRQLAGDLHRAAEAWRSALLRAQAMIEAAIDFSDEADVSERAVTVASDMVLSIRRQLESTLADDHKGEILRNGFQIAIAGHPNVGKSSLINAIARRDAAIVSSEPGTTRDVIELHLNLGGLPVTIADTAGLRETEGLIEREGIRRGLERASSADFVIWVTDINNPGAEPPLDLEHGQILRVINKIDLKEGIYFLPPDPIFSDQMGISTVTGEGIAALVAKISSVAQARTTGGETALITTARHRQHLEAAYMALSDFVEGAPTELELRAEDIRRAALSIGRLVGKIDAEEILGEIFGKFCIGK